MSEVVMYSHTCINALRYLIQGLINVTVKWFYVIIFFTAFNGLVVLQANVT